MATRQESVRENGASGGYPTLYLSRAVRSSIGSAVLLAFPLTLRFFRAAAAAPTDGMEKVIESFMPLLLLIGLGFGIHAIYLWVKSALFEGHPVSRCVTYALGVALFLYFVWDVALRAAVQPFVG